MYSGRIACAHSNIEMLVVSRNLLFSWWVMDTTQGNMLWLALTISAVTSVIVLSLCHHCVTGQNLSVP